MSLFTPSGAVTFPAGGRGIDLNNNGTITSQEGLNAVPPYDIIVGRDGLRQTVVDLMQLVRVIEAGVDIHGDGVPNLDPSRIYYAGLSLGGIYGTVFLAVEPRVRAGVLIVPGGPLSEVGRLGSFRSGASLAARVPSLINVGGTQFNENMPLRNQPPVINTVPGAIAIQQLFEHREWVSGASDPVAYAVHLQKQPLDGVPAKPLIVQFAKGDKTNPNPTTTAMLRAGDLAEQATFYRHDLAFAANPAGCQKTRIFFCTSTILCSFRHWCRALLWICKRKWPRFSPRTGRWSLTPTAHSHYSRSRSSHRCRRTGFYPLVTDVWRNLKAMQTRGGPGVTFEEILTQASAILQRLGRVSYRALKRQFALDDAFLEDLRYELIEIQQRAVDHDGIMLVWTGETSTAAAPLQPRGSVAAPPPTARHARNRSRTRPPIWRRRS